MKDENQALWRNFFWDSIESCKNKNSTIKKFVDMYINDRVGKPPYH